MVTQTQSIQPPNQPSNHVQRSTNVTLAANKTYVTSELLMARKKIGISSITRNDLQYFCGHCNIDTKTVSDSDLFYGDKCKEVRAIAAADYLDAWLGIKLGSINIADSKMAKNPDSGILWLEVGVNNVNNIFMKAANVKNLKVTLHSFFPHCVWDRKTSLQHNLFQEQKRNNSPMEEIVEEVPVVKVPATVLPEDESH